MNTSNFGLPQNRERVYMVGFNKNEFKEIKFSFPNPNLGSSLEKILELNPENAKIIDREDISIYKECQPTKNIFNEIYLPNKPIQIGKVNKGGQGERIYHPSGHAITLSAYGGGVGSKTGLYKVNEVIRKLSPRECARIQGFPENFILPKSITEAQKQFGNSVSIDVLQFILKEISKTFNIMTNHQELGSRTAKNGFQNEKDIVQKFNHWKTQPQV